MIIGGAMMDEQPEQKDSDILKASVQLLIQDSKKQAGKDPRTSMEIDRDLFGNLKEEITLVKDYENEGDGLVTRAQAKKLIAESRKRK